MTIRVIKPDIATGEYLETGNIMMINNFAKDEEANLMSKLYFTLTGTKYIMDKIFWKKICR